MSDYISIFFKCRYQNGHRFKRRDSWIVGLWLMIALYGSLKDNARLLISSQARIVYWAKKGRNAGWLDSNVGADYCLSWCPVNSLIFVPAVLFCPTDPAQSETAQFPNCFARPWRFRAITSWSLLETSSVILLLVSVVHFRPSWWCPVKRFLVLFSAWFWSMVPIRSETVYFHNFISTQL